MNQTADLELKINTSCNWKDLEDCIDELHRLYFISEINQEEYLKTRSHVVERWQAIHRNERMKDGNFKN